MKKYIRLACSVCKRTVDQLVDNTRFAPDKCTITLKCQGRLSPVEYRSDGQITTAPAIGVTDWAPRGAPSTGAAAILPTRFIDTSTGVLQQAVLAVRLNTEPAPGSTASLTLQTKTEAPKAFRSFVFQRDTEFSTISGVESGVSQKTLRFKTWGPDPDEVEVYLNGAKLLRGTGPSSYQVDDGSATPPAPSNTIRFNTPVLPVGTFHVEVIVSKAVPEVTSVVTFTRNSDNDSRLDLGAWENVSHIDRFDGTSLQSFYLFTFDVKDNTTLARDSILFPVGTVLVNTETGSEVVNLTDCFFALSRKPHTKVDRYPDISAYLSDINADRDFLKYVEIGGVLSLGLADTSLTTHFPPSTVRKFNAENTIKVRVAGEEEQLVVDGKVIVGPDT